jgi:Protein of unknown function (DUF2997)
MKTIELVVSPNGETTLQTRGFTGDSCREASAFLEAALGAKQSDRPTTEAFTATEETTLHHSS